MPTSQPDAPIPLPDAARTLDYLLFVGEAHFAIGFTGRPDFAEKFAAQDRA